METTYTIRFIPTDADRNFLFVNGPLDEAIENAQMLAPRFSESGEVHIFEDIDGDDVLAAIVRQDMDSAQFTVEYR